MTAPVTRNAGATRGWAFVGPAVVWTLAFFIVPFVMMVCYSLWQRAGTELVRSWNLDNYTGFLDKPHFVAGLQNSLEITVLVTAVSIILAYPLAWIIAERVPRRWQRLALLLAILPFWTSYVVRSYAWLLVLSRGGYLNQFLVGAGIIDSPLEITATRAAFLAAARTMVGPPMSMFSTARARSQPGSRMTSRKG